MGASLDRVPTVPGGTRSANYLCRVSEVSSGPEWSWSRRITRSKCGKPSNSGRAWRRFQKCSFFCRMLEMGAFLKPLRRVLETPEKDRERLRHAAMARVRDHYSWDAVTGAYEGLLKAMMK